MKNKRYLNWLEQYYIFCMIPIAGLVSYYNYYAKGMSILLNSYASFAKVIQANFDTSADTHYPLTFPMWGYGFLMAITTNKIVLIATQIFFALLSLWYFIRTIEKSQI
jgi:hypothetical protein